MFHMLTDLACVHVCYTGLSHLYIRVHTFMAHRDRQCELQSFYFYTIFRPYLFMRSNIFTSDCTAYKPWSCNYRTRCTKRHSFLTTIFPPFFGQIATFNHAVNSQNSQENCWKHDRFTHPCQWVYSQLQHVSTQVMCLYGQSTYTHGRRVCPFMIRMWLDMLQLACTQVS